MERNCVKCNVVTNADLCGDCNQKVVLCTYVNGKQTYVFDDNTSARVYPGRGRSKKTKEQDVKETTAFPIKKKLPKI